MPNVSPQRQCPTTPEEQDDIAPSAYTRHTLANFGEEKFPHQACAKRVPGRTVRRGERSTTNRVRVASLRARAMHPNTLGAGRTRTGPSTRRAVPPLPEW